VEDSIGDLESRTLTGITKARSIGSPNNLPDSNVIGEAIWYSKDNFRGLSRIQESTDIWTYSDAESRKECMFRLWYDENTFSSEPVVRYYKNKGKELETFSGTGTLHYVGGRSGAKVSEVSLPVKGLLYKYIDCECYMEKQTSTVLCNIQKSN